MALRKNTIQLYTTEEEKRLLFFRIGVFFLFLIIIFRLFTLQVVQGSDLRAEAQEQRMTTQTIAPKRGNIYTRDSVAGKPAPLAINVTMYKVALDPAMTDDPDLIAQELTEILYTTDRHNRCKTKKDYCASVVFEEGEEGEMILPSYEIAKKKFFDFLLQSGQMKEKTSFILQTGVEESILLEIEKRALLGVTVSLKAKHIVIDTTQFNSINKKTIAKSLSEILNTDEDIIEKSLVPKKERYVEILSRVPLEIKETILEKKNNSRKEHFRDKYRYDQDEKAGKKNIPPVLPFFWEGVIIEEEHFRYYPEGSLAAQVVGFVNREGEGQYGIEEELNDKLKGKYGKIQGQGDVKNVTVAIKGDTIEQVEDGADVILTLDRRIQREVEKILREDTEAYKADSGQIIVMDPKTGAILAMAGYPSFDPNSFGNVYLMRQSIPEDFERASKTTPLFTKDEKGNYTEASYDEFIHDWEVGFPVEKYFLYENLVGQQAYRNRSIMDIYEPGSVFKPLVMAMAMDAGEISEHSTYNETGPKIVDDFAIKNSDSAYLGIQTMTNILERSANLGMVYITEKMGKPLLYHALKKYAFEEYIDIFLADENKGQLAHYKQWSDARLYTLGFGQGLTATPLQVARAWCSLANGGYLIRPHIVQEMHYGNGEKEEMEYTPQRILKPDTAETIKRMLVKAVESGVARNAKVPEHYVAGKTGTSQIASIDGPGYEDLSEDGSTITSFVGFAPIADPQFVVLVKYDRARVGVGRTYGSSTAAPTFSRIMDFLLRHSHEKPDKF